MTGTPQLPPGASPVPPWLDRSVAVLVVAAAIVVVWLLAGVHPDARGHGTHEQLGMAPCGWAEELGRPCPTCGVTTAATHVVHLQPVEAVRVQPFGAALALLGLLLAVLALHSLLTGRSFAARIRSGPYGYVVVGLLLLFLASWGYCWLTWTR